MLNWMCQREAEMKTKETRTFDMIDDNSENFFVGQIIRMKHEVKPELWNLRIGQYLNTSATQAFVRAR